MDKNGNFPPIFFGTSKFGKRGISGENCILKAAYKAATIWFSICCNFQECKSVHCYSLIALAKWYVRGVGLVNHFVGTKDTDAALEAA